MSGAIETLPQLAYRHLLNGMHELRRECRERPQHKSALQQVRPRQLQPRLVENQVAV
jgi:hypothetical protein